MNTKTLILVSMLLASSIASSAQNAITTYTLTPHTNLTTSVNVSCSIRSSNGQINDYPTGSIYPVFSRDSSKVQFFCIYDQTNRPMSVADSINHFQTGSFVFPVKGVKSMDSFFYNVMVK